MVQAAKAEATRERLLEAAAEVFAEQGFQNATIQKICGRAGANIAAANYHFGGKEGLYTAVFERALARGEEEARLQGEPSGTAEQRLRGHIANFLCRLLDPANPTWTARLLAREMIEPTPALDRIVRQRMRANHERFAAAIADILGPGASAEAIRLCTLSVVAQCVFYRNSDAIVTRLYPDLQPAREIERLAEHIAGFSIAAIRGLRRAGKANKS